MPAPLVAVAQLTSTPDPQQNLNRISTHVSLAARDSITLLCLPESFDFIAPPHISPSLSHPLTSPLISTYHKLSTHHNIHLSLGGFHESHPSLPSTHFYNTHLLLSPTNPTAPLALYRKLHLFDVTLPSQSILESNNTTAGSHLTLARDTPFGPIGLSTCYDLRFPALYEALRHAGANLLLIPSAFFPHTGAAHWHTLVRARAIETQCYVAAAAQVGHHPGTSRCSYGHSLIVDPFGEVLEDAGAEDSNVYVSAPVDAKRIQSVRANMPVVEHRRSDVLGPVPGVRWSQEPGLK
eukprot:GFKZ01001586.1.p1 GENE.GFKZ01001586.1~~GFKZ01001586.1.p1  ORF type:complete len:318 (+),score=22.72 GFKZ01001586.1:74-955(+)